MNNKNIVYLVDGSAYIYRAYYAVKKFSKISDYYTNAVFGFSNMIIKLLNEKKPKYLAIFFDVKGKTFRHLRYDQYKKNRPPMPRDLIKQIPWIKKIVIGFGIPNFELLGFEADDLIGTTAKIAIKNGLSVVMVSSDKDLMQLIDSDCVLWDPMKNILIDKNTIKLKFGVGTSQMVDVMALSGDRIDNIPGVPGIGVKTATKIIKKFGSMMECYDNINNILQDKQRNNLLRFKRAAFLSHNLVKININSPISISINDFMIKSSNKKYLFFLFKKLGFRRLQKKIMAQK